MRKRATITINVIAFWFMATASNLFAGGGPENVLIVINPTSENSKEIGKFYADLRKIPSSNIVEIPWDAKEGVIKVKDFRTRILEPILIAISNRGLVKQIDCIAYSCDFPWLVHCDYDQKVSWGQGNKPPKYLREEASITGVTYLYESVLAGKGKEYISLNSNRYSFASLVDRKRIPSRAFKNAFQFDRFGNIVNENGRRYMMSVMLGVTFGRGNTVQEIKNYLSRAAEADGKKPKGTIYLHDGPGIRSITRSKQFDAVVKQLNQLDVRSEVIKSHLPKYKTDVMGLLNGTHNFKWPDCKSTILPGAICEHLTSFGGVMHARSAQTPFSEFLRYGAAGSSGTVIEPFAIAAKFPNASMHVHYARGCTLAESFYQSVAGPYQLLIVGDPLCQPWANIPKITASGFPKDGTVKGPLKISALATGVLETHHFTLYTDGIRTHLNRDGSFEIDTTKLKNGKHEFRIVAVGPSPVFTQGHLVKEIEVAN